MSLITEGQYQSLNAHMYLCIYIHIWKCSAAPGGPASQSSPGSLAGASSADATVMTMSTGSQVSGEGRVAPPESIATRSDARIGNAKKSLRRFTRSTSPRTNIDKSPKRSIERVEIEDALPCFGTTTIEKKKKKRRMKRIPDVETSSTHQV